MKVMQLLIAGAQNLGIHFSPRQLEQFEIYYHELVDWNEKINLTAITGYEEVQTKHFLDSLTVIAAIKQEDRKHPQSVIDVGTGAGFPGIPLKIILPDIKLVLLEATIKKTKFLDSLITKLGLKDVEIAAARAEDIAHDARYREKFDYALSRAVASLPSLAELTLPFCAIGGICIAQKKGEIKKETEDSKKAITVLGGLIREIIPVTLEYLADNRILVVIEKIRVTPTSYPRRPGMPVKRPILDNNS
jgi:16S rRNA (guanine527-N7)-methyltransferase